MFEERSIQVYAKVFGLGIEYLIQQWARTSYLVLLQKALKKYVSDKYYLYMVADNNA